MEPSVPTTASAGLPAATHSRALHATMSAGQEVERLAPTVLPHRSAGARMALLSATKKRAPACM